MSKKCNAAVESKPCEKSSFATCDGCHQSFCLPHLIAHQQQLGTQMEDIVRDHDLLREELNKHCIHSKFKMPDFADELSMIDAWEARTLAHVTNRVNQEADRARYIIYLVIDENRERAHAIDAAISEDFGRLKKRLAMLGEQLQRRMKTSDYLESDLHQWNTELSDIKRFCLTPQAPTHMIVNKLIVRETKQIQIDVSNILDIKDEDNERIKISDHLNKTKNWANSVVKKTADVYNFATERISGEFKIVHELLCYDAIAHYINIVDTTQEILPMAYNYPEILVHANRTSDTANLVQTVEKKVLKIYSHTAETTSGSTMISDNNNNKNKRSDKK